MTHTRYFLLFVCLAFVGTDAFAETFTIPAQDPTPVKGVRSKKAIKIFGDISIIPMSGMTVVLRTSSLGDIIVGKRYNFPEPLGRKFDTLESRRTHVEMQGVVLTFCATKQLEAGTLGCRMFDPSGPIKVNTK